MSLKAGGVGINLTAASNAFVMVYFIRIFLKFIDGNIFSLDGLFLFSSFLWYPSLGGSNFGFS